MTIPDLIEPITDKKETLGQQWLNVQEKYAGQMTQNVRETTTAMTKSYYESFEKIWNAHKHVTQDYYIWETMRIHPKLDGVIECKHVARLSRPIPEWGTTLFKVSNQNGECIVEWGLPAKHEAMIMMQNKEGWDENIISDIEKYLAGTLV